MTELDARKRWTRMSLAECCDEIAQRVDNPSESGLDRFVGLEHLDTGEITIRRWGDTADVTSSMKLFQSGDVIVARRNVYLKRAASAGFDGVCSGDGIVLRAKPRVCLPELLPFLLNTDAFWDYAISQADGTMSKRITVKRLLGYEFRLPPIMEQRRFMSLLSAWKRADQALLSLGDACGAVFRTALDTFFSQGIDRDASRVEGDLVLPETWTAARLDRVAKVERGKFSHRPRNLPEFYGGKYPFAQTGDVAAGCGYRFLASQRLSDEGVKYSRSFPPHTILITIAAVIGATAITSEETWCTDSVVGIVPNESADARFLDYAMRYRRSYLEYKVATQTAQKNINLEILRPLLIPWPSQRVRREVACHLSAIEAGIDDVRSRRSALRVLPDAVVSRIRSEQ